MADVLYIKTVFTDVNLVHNIVPSYCRNCLVISQCTVIEIISSPWIMTLAKTKRNYGISNAVYFNQQGEQ